MGIVSCGVLLSVWVACFYSPQRAYVALPLKVQVIDAEKGLPIDGAEVLRIVADYHDRAGSRAVMDRTHSDENGNIRLAGRQKWVFLSGPGRLPLPNHQIAVWKPGYKAFVFSQYGDIHEIYSGKDRIDLIKALETIPLERRVYRPDKETNGMFFSTRRSRAISFSI